MFLFLKSTVITSVQNKYVPAPAYYPSIFLSPIRVTVKEYSRAKATTMACGVQLFQTIRGDGQKKRNV